MSKKRYSLFRVEKFGRNYYWVPFGPKASYARTADRLRQKRKSQMTEHTWCGRPLSELSDEEYEVARKAAAAMSVAISPRLKQDHSIVKITETFEKCSVEEATLFIYGDPYRKISTSVDGKIVR